MNKHLIALAAAVVLAFACGSPARADGIDTVLLGNRGWEAFAGSASHGSLAWAGEDETFFASRSVLGSLPQAVAFDENAVDVALLTALAAPEPPALVLAGMAFGGVLCGRSLLMRRRARSESAGRVEESRG